ncbi:MAG: hypothetical protein SVY41_01445, partial [Candidatus Nanohaloarchaea archaeon]|nr:hypothetical protein [Candidatus Nanohaloarchaea archaeon]
WENESDAAAFLEDRITGHGVDVHPQDYQVLYPEWSGYRVEADGTEIECLPCGFESGEIGKTVVDSLTVDERVFDEANINFNPRCEGISVASFYDAPAVAVSKQDIGTVLAADDVHGELTMSWERYGSRNLLVGNREDPDLVVFTHYDSFWGGFLDNALSVAVLVELLQDIDLSRTLVVFAGSEEVSQQDPYWCYGYRQFETRYSDVLEQCSAVVVADGMGRGPVQVRDERWLLEKALVLDNPEAVWPKTELLTSGFEALMPVYHTPVDTPDKATHVEDAITTTRQHLAEWRARP